VSRGSGNELCTPEAIKSFIFYIDAINTSEGWTLLLTAPWTHIMSSFRIPRTIFVNLTPNGTAGGGEGGGNLQGPI
jgi:hypothetical protein